MAIRINNNITFIHIGKNAGTSVTHTVTKNLKTESSGKTHDSWEDIPTSWQDRGFAVIRNPFNRLVSHYLFGKRKSLKYLGYKNKNAERRKEIEQEVERYNRGFEWWVLNFPSPKDLSQTMYLPKDYSPISLLIYENINNEWEKLCQKESWPKLKLVQHNTNPNTETPYNQYHTEKTIAWVKKHLSADINLYQKITNRLLPNHPKTTQDSEYFSTFDN